MSSCARCERNERCRIARSLPQRCAVRAVGVKGGASRTCTQMCTSLVMSSVPGRFFWLNGYQPGTHDVFYNHVCLPAYRLDSGVHRLRSGEGVS